MTNEQNLKIIREKRWLEHELGLIRTTIAGAMIGQCLVYGIEDCEKTYRAIDKAMELIEKDVKRIYKHAKRQASLIVDKE